MPKVVCMEKPVEFSGFKLQPRANRYKENAARVRVLLAGKRHLRQGLPAISVDTKKKELVGNDRHVEQTEWLGACEAAEDANKLPASRKVVERQHNVLPVDIDFQHLVDRLTAHSQLIERRLKQQPLNVLVHRRDDDHQASMQRLHCIEPPKIRRVVGHQHEIALAGIAQNLRVFPARAADMSNVMRRVPGLRSNGNQVNGQAFVNQKPHTLSADKGTRTRCADGRSCQGCRRGRPRCGYAAAYTGASWIISAVRRG